MSALWCNRDPESSNVLDYCNDAVMVVPALPEKEVDVLCNSFSLEQQVTICVNRLSLIFEVHRNVILFICDYCHFLVGAPSLWRACC